MCINCSGAFSNKPKSNLIKHFSKAYAPLFLPPTSLKENGGELSKSIQNLFAKKKKIFETKK